MYDRRNMSLRPQIAFGESSNSDLIDTFEEWRKRNAKRTSERALNGTRMGLDR